MGQILPVRRQRSIMADRGYSQAARHLVSRTCCTGHPFVALVIADALDWLNTHCNEIDEGLITLTFLCLHLLHPVRDFRFNGRVSFMVGYGTSGRCSRGSQGIEERQRPESPGQSGRTATLVNAHPESPGHGPPPSKDKTFLATLVR